MSVSDPIADMLTAIRNANNNYHEKVEVPASRLKQGIVEILKQEGFIRNYRLIDDHRQGILRIYLKYGADKKRAINRIERVSLASVRRYAGKGEIPKVRGGLGVLILSTNRGLMSDAAARRAGVGGELLCRVW
ncbi:30S ribosomal protein S8 [bacterium]|nr:30S ribosomal protein S8 [bacterium]